MEKILVIDDEKPTLMMFRLTLEAYGYTVLTAENGEQGVELFASERPPIVLTDIKMPGMSGIEVLRRVKELEPRAEVIVITGHGDMDLAIQALNLDATDFINKPIQRHLLEQAISRARERRQRSGGPAADLRLEGAAEAARILIAGHLTAEAEPRLLGLYRDALAAGKPVIRLEFSGATAVNGAGIAVLTQLALDARDRGLRVVAGGLTENLRRVFEIVGLSKLLEFDGGAPPAERG